MEVLEKTKKKPKTQLAKNIIEGRKKLKMSAMKFAEFASVPYPTIRDIEAGLSRGNAITRALIGKAFDIDDYLLEKPDLWKSETIPTYDEGVKRSHEEWQAEQTKSKPELILTIQSRLTALNEKQLRSVLGFIDDLGDIAGSSSSSDIG